MIIDATESRLLVISDLHIGNPCRRGGQALLDFLDVVAQEGYSLVINGDVFDVAQSSFQKIACDVPSVLAAMRRIRKAGGNVYYVIGNHDIVLEHVLQDWDFAILSPFLNVVSGDKRIRIEHGHLYDPFFVQFPRAYEFATHLAGGILSVLPQAFEWWKAFENWAYADRRSEPGHEQLAGASADFPKAAREILSRGFDAVVFGHTHHPGVLDLPPHGTYFNSGSWLFAPHYVDINQGTVTLRKWDGRFNRTPESPESGASATPGAAVA